MAEGDGRFLFARLSALGDVVCSLPAAVALKEARPEAHIAWVVDPRFAAVARACTAVDEVIEHKPKGLAAPLYSGPFEAAFDLQGLFKSGWAVHRARAARKLGYHWQREGSWLFSERVLPDPTSFHIVDQYVDVVRAYGVAADRARFALKPSEEDVLSVRRKLKERGLSGRFVVMNAGAGWATKRWPPGHFAEVVHRLSLPAVFVGGRSEADRQAVGEIGADFVDLVGETSVGELIALIRLASAHLGGDTGSTHLAAAMYIPAVGLYSITRPQRSCPYGQFDRCLYAPEGLAHIAPEPVWAKLEGALR